MMNDHIKRILRGLIFLSILGLVLYVMADDLEEILEEIMHTNILILLQIGLLATGFHLLEALNNHLLSKPLDPPLSYVAAVKISFIAAFYRFITFGSGSGLSAVYYMNKEGLDVGSTVSLTSFQYITHRIMMAFFAILFYATQQPTVLQAFGNLQSMMRVGLWITILLIVGLSLAIIFTGFHQGIIGVLRALDKKKRFEEKIEKLSQTLDSMRDSALIFLKDPKTISWVFFINALKLLSLYTIPFVVLRGYGVDMTWIQTAGIMSLVLALAGVIPTPSGLGSVELLFLASFQAFAGSVKASSAVLLYRFILFIFPAAIGGLILLSTRMRFKQNESVI